MVNFVSPILEFVCIFSCYKVGTDRKNVMILSFRTDGSGQTVYTVCNAVFILWMQFSMVKPPCSNLG